MSVEKENNSREFGNGENETRKSMCTSQAENTIGTGIFLPVSRDRTTPWTSRAYSHSLLHGRNGRVKANTWPYLRKVQHGGREGQKREQSLRPPNNIKRADTKDWLTPRFERLRSNLFAEAEKRTGGTSLPSRKTCTASSVSAVREHFARPFRCTPLRAWRGDSPSPGR
jgi:hypothetical protein